jgi:hypothetical protein
MQHLVRRPRPRFTCPRVAAVVAMVTILGVATCGCSSTPVVDMPTAIDSANGIPPGDGSVPAPAALSNTGSSAASLRPAPASSGAPSSTAPSSTAPSRGQVGPMASSPPVRLQIPVIGVDSGLLALGLQDDGTLEVPPDAASVGWFTGGPMPGELGPAVIVGQVDWGGALGIFYDLRNLAPQDEITVTREDGSVAVFQVRTREQFPKDQFPTDAVYGNIDHAGLRLITCGGSFDRRARSYEDNIIVFADLVDSSSP